MANLSELESLITREVDPSDVPHATQIDKRIPIDDCDGLRRTQSLKTELAGVLLSGPGAFVFRDSYQDSEPIDAATQVFNEIIAEESRLNRQGDHFAKPGANARIWNSLEKLCLRAPDVFARYHGNPWLTFASESWLGPAFQMTAQVNLVQPGGEAQDSHCDYHLGFMTPAQVAMYPPHVHKMSSRLTLQGAIAHGDMPVESGTTRLLPFSQLWSDNYRSFQDSGSRELFAKCFVQLALKKGDVLFLSPGLLHAAGDNRTRDIKRMANLLQVSSPFGRAMEAVNRTAMCKALFPVIMQAKANDELSAIGIEAAIECCAEGYPFPTNLDLDPPLGGRAPMSQQALFVQAVEEDWSCEAFHDAIGTHAAKRR